MTTKSKFSGVGVALVTPFKQCGAIDFEALTRLIDHVSSGGVDYLVVMGTTAESPTLTAVEKKQVLTHVIANNQSKLPIVYGMGGNNTMQLVEELQATDLHGVDGILSVAPYYNKPNQEGLYNHFKAVLEASPLPVIMYNIPGRTGVNMTAATTLRLAHDFGPKAAGIKEASGNISQMAYIIKDRPEGFLVISGDDNLTLPLIALGGDGVISVSANAFATTMSMMVHHAMDHQFIQAAALNFTLLSVTDMLFEEGNPAGVKSILERMKIMDNVVRMPLVVASAGLSERIASQASLYNLL